MFKTFVQLLGSYADEVWLCGYIKGLDDFLFYVMVINDPVKQRKEVLYWLLSNDDYYVPHCASTL